jgi:uncharacterized domain HDIG
MTKYYPTDELVPGMVTAGEVRTKGGQLIVENGVSLTDRLISRIKFYAIPQVSVTEDPIPATKKEEQVEVPSHVVKPEAQAPSYSQKVVCSKEFQNFQISYSRVIATYRTVLEDCVIYHKSLNYEQLLSDTKELYYSCKTSLELFDMLHNMRSVEDSVYAHSLNVSLISRRLGRWLKFSPEELDTLTLAGALHDIGKLKIPAEVLNKPGKYTDEEFALVKQHPKFGYDILKSLPLDSHVKKAALCHHERSDGSGYPTGLSQSDIDDYAAIVSIADVYDAMTAARSYRAPLCVFQVINNFEHDGLSKYNPKFILTFLSHVASTYQNNRVLLNDGRVANIVMLNKNRLSKPIIQLMDGSCIDLSTQPDLHIQSVL